MALRRGRSARYGRDGYDEVPVAGVALIPAVPGGEVYVTHASLNGISVIDAGTNTLKETFDLSGVPTGLAPTRFGSELYVAIGSKDEVQLIDASPLPATS